MAQNRVYTVTVNPAWDRTVLLGQLVPGGTNLARSVQGDAGGKGVNVSRILQAFGLPTTALGLLGGGAGDRLLGCLQAEGVPQAFERLSADCRTNTKLVDLGAGVTTEVNEPGPPAEPAALACLEGRLAALPAGSVAALCGSLPGQLPAGWYAQAAQLCHRAGCRVVLDTSREPLRQALAGEPEILKPNAEELGQLCGRQPDSAAGAAAMARGLLWGRTGLAAVSLGAQGAVFVTAGCAVWAKAPRVQPVSTVGAGDTLTAVLAAWLAGQPQGWAAVAPGRLARLAAGAVAAASAKVLQPGTQPPDLGEIARLQRLVETELL